MRRRKVSKKSLWALLSKVILCLNLVGCQDSELALEDVKTNDYVEEAVYESTVESVSEIIETTEQETEEEIVSEVEETTIEVIESQVVEESVIPDIPESSVEKEEELLLEPIPAPEPQPEPVQATGGSGSYAVNGKNGKIHIVGDCPATGTGKNAMKEPHYFNTYEEADAYSSGIEGDPDKRKCGNCW